MFVTYGLFLDKRATTGSEDKKTEY